MNIYDVSERAGVSIATVSRVLNGNPNVREQTRSKVLAIMDELGYTPNVFARGLGLNTMKTIGIMCSDSSDPYLANAIYFLERQLRSHGYDSLLEAAKELPIMLVNGYLDAPGIYSTVCDDHGAMYDAASLLIHSGRNRILYLYTSHSYSGLNKIQGYKDALSDLEFPVRKELIHQCTKNLTAAKQLIGELADYDV